MQKDGGRLPPICSSVGNDCSQIIAAKELTVMVQKSGPNPKQQVTDSEAFPALPEYVSLREGVYQFRRRIPAHVVRALRLKGDQFTRSLKTRDLQTATGRLDKTNREFNELVASATKKPGKDPTEKNSVRPRGEGTTKYLLPEHIPHLLSRFEYALLSTDDEERKAMDRQGRAERLAMLEDGLSGPEGLYEQAASENYEHVEEVAQLMLTNEGLLAPPGSFVRKQLLREMLAKDIEMMEVQRDRLRGRPRLTPNAVPVAPRDLPTLKTLFSSWASEQNVVRTVDTYRGYVEAFESLLGALPVVSITKEHVFEFRDYLAECDLVRETVKNRVGGLATLVNFGSSKGLIELVSNPFANVRYGHIAKAPESEKRRAYEISELVLLFSSPVYTRGHRPEGQAAESAFWAPLLGPFVGARIEEIAQLRVDDVQCINGEWAIRIADLDEKQHLKTNSSYRLVPVHEELKRCGFLTYVNNVRSSGHEMVFPSHRNDNKHMRWANAFGKWFGRYLTEVGLVDPRLDYHSLRFNFKQQCSICGIENEVRDALSGHWLSDGDSGKGYMRTPERQYPFPVLVQAIKKLRYTELDLSHLYC